MAAKINETYLFWVLAVRAQKRALAVKSPFKWHDIAHTEASWAWANKQAERIDEVGLDAWLKTRSACAPERTAPWFDEWVEEGKKPEKEREKKKCDCPPGKCLRQLK